MPKNAPSAVCRACHDRRANMTEEEREYQDQLDEARAWRTGEGY